jgi:hypothetical protein
MTTQRGRITAASNKGMKQTKPAQAMELRGLSPVFDRLEDEHGESASLAVAWRNSASS